MPKKGLKVWITGKEKKVFKMHIDLTGSNKVPILDKCPPTKNVKVKIFIGFLITMLRKEINVH